MKDLSSRGLAITNIQDYLIHYSKIVKESFYIRALKLGLDSEWSSKYSLKELFELEDFLRSYVTSQHSYKEKLIIDLIQLGKYKKVYKLGPPYYVDISKDAIHELRNEFAANEILKMSEFISSINSKTPDNKSKDELVEELLMEAKLNKINEIHEPVYIDLIAYTKKDIGKFYSSAELTQAIEYIKVRNTSISKSKRKPQSKKVKVVEKVKLKNSIIRDYVLKRNNPISKIEEEPLSTISKESLVEEIFRYAEEELVFKVGEPFYLDLEFDEREDLITNFSEKELQQIFEKLKSNDKSLKDQGNLLNPLSIINMFEEGAVKVVENIDKNIWRKYIPATLRYDLAGKSIEEAVNIINEKIKLINRQHANYKEWMKFKQELEEILYEEDVIEEEQIDFEKEWEEDIEIALQIRKTVETIILPHLEILQRLEEHNGKIKLVNVNEQPFNESLKKDVRERDNYACVICNGVANLHVHHKIPRKLGGPNHIYNLVTVCSSCHSAVETADPLYAFTKGITNYFKNNNQRKYYEAELRDPEAIKSELIEKLDALILENRRNLILKDELVEILRGVERL